MAGPLDSSSRRSWRLAGWTKLAAALLIIRPRIRLRASPSCYLLIQAYEIRYVMVVAVTNPTATKRVALM